MQEIFFPDFIGESDYGMVVMVSGLDEGLEPLFNRYLSGEDVEYWFAWDLVQVENDGFLVTLGVSWDNGGEGVSIGLPSELWHMLPSLKEKENLALMTDWTLVDGSLDEEDDIYPRALLIREAYRGLDDLAFQVAEITVTGGGSRELSKLQEILCSCIDTGLIH